MPRGCPAPAARVFSGQANFQSLGQGEQGALAAAPIFRDFMKEALADPPPTPFRIPQGIALVPTNPLNGAVVPQGSPGAILEAFKAGTGPFVLTEAVKDDHITLEKNPAWWGKSSAGHALPLLDQPIFQPIPARHVRLPHLTPVQAHLTNTHPPTALRTGNPNPPQPGPRTACGRLGCRVSTP